MSQSFKYIIYLLIAFNFIFGRTYAQKNKEQVEIISLDQDSILFNELIQWWWLQPEDSRSKKCRDQIPFVAKYLLNTPYVEKTLEVGDKECLVVNLREMDCVTYVENVLAITSILNKSAPSWDDFIQSLIKIRYRDGIIKDYSSRFHYTSEWLQKKVEDGFLILVSDYIGDQEMDTNVDFMTKNSHLYKRLKGNTKMIAEMQKNEKNIASYNMKYVEKENIESVESFLKEGDIIGFVSTVSGLDFSHIGFATVENGRIHLLHASPLLKQVGVTELPLADYLKDNSSVLGIVVGRIQ